MHPSKRHRRILHGLLGAIAAPAAILACNGIIGLDDYDKAECAGGFAKINGVCSGDAGGNPDVIINEGGGGEGGADSSVDGGRGTEPVSWAKWPMPNYVWPASAGVEAGAPRPPIYTSTGADEVSDTITQLVWKNAPLNGGAPSTFEAAEKACKTLAPAGQWRLPKRIELITLVDFGQLTAPLIDQTKFPAFPVSRMWTSSEERKLDLAQNAPAKATGSFWTVSFETGEVAPQPQGTAIAGALCIKANL